MAITPRIVATAQSRKVRHSRYEIVGTRSSDSTTATTMYVTSVSNTQAIALANNPMKSGIPHVPVSDSKKFSLARLCAAGESLLFTVPPVKRSGQALVADRSLIVPGSVGASNLDRRRPLRGQASRRAAKGRTLATRYRLRRDVRHPAAQPPPPQAAVGAGVPARNTASDSCDTPPPPS
jgi:hypothetical protein